METRNPLTNTGERTLSRTGVTSMGGNEPRAVVLIASSRSLTEVVAFGPEGILTVGRGEGASVRVSDPTLSRVHARFRLVGERVIITDLGSRNGTFLGGRRITEAEVAVGQSVVLGGVTVELRVAPARDALMMDIADYGEILARLADELARARDFRRPLTVFLVRAKDRLRANLFATECRAVLRTSDRVGLHDRFSLLVVSPECDVERAEATAAALRAASPNGVALQIGTATYPAQGSSADRLLGLCLESVSGAPPQEPAHIDAHSVVIRSPAMTELHRLVERLAPSRLSVLVSGETGAGKEIVARAIHDTSPRAAAPFVPVNCGSIPEKLVESMLFGHTEGAFTGASRDAPGLFERAAGGTLFLDEVAELSQPAQAALLRVLDTGRFRLVGATGETAVDVRIIAASHRNLPALVEKKEFRADLFHRLSGATLCVPPLRERRTEIRSLTLYFLEHAGRAWGATSALQITPDALAALERHRWPGNVRELKNVIERAVAVTESGVITLHDLPPSLLEPASPASPVVGPVSPNFPRDGLDLRSEVERHERSIIERALERTGGHQRKAAELLRLPLRTLERKLSRLGKDDPPSE